MEPSTTPQTPKSAHGLASLPQNGNANFSMTPLSTFTLKPKRGRPRKDATPYSANGAKFLKIEENQESPQQVADLSPFEQLRLKNIQAREAMMAELDVQGARNRLKEAMQAVRTYRRQQHAAQHPPLPPRDKSPRIAMLQKMTPTNMNFLPSPKPKMVFDLEDCLEDSSFANINHFYSILSSHEVSNIGTKTRKSLPRAVSSIYKSQGMALCDAQEFVDKIGSLRCNSEKMIELVRGTMTDLTFHPTERVLLLAASGTGRGSVSLCSVGTDSEDWEKTVATLGVTAHSSRVNHVSFSEIHPHVLYTCGSDGTLRRTDFESRKVEVLHQTTIIKGSTLPEVLWHCVEAASGLLLAGRVDGHVSAVDPRSRNDSRIFCIGKGKVRTVSTSRDQYYKLVTCCEEGIVALWDIRMMESGTRASSLCTPLWETNLEIAAESAFLSNSGSRLLTTLNFNQVRVFNVQRGSSPVPYWEMPRDPERVVHYSYRKAVWHPRRDDYFCVWNSGLEHGLDVFNINSKPATAEPGPAAAAGEDQGEPGGSKKAEGRVRLECQDPKGGPTCFHPSLPVMAAGCTTKLALFI